MADDPQQGKTGQRYPSQALRDYALIADGERGALVGPHGEYVWMCAPAWNSDAVFAELIGGAGVYAVTPVGRYVWGGYYESRSLIWRSRWITEDAVVECREALAFPGDPHTAVLLRQITAQDRPARLRVVLEPRAGFGSQPMDAVRQDEDGVWHLASGSLRMRWSGAPRARLDDGALTMDLTLKPGETHELVLEMSQRPLGRVPVDAPRAWRETEAAWRREVPALPGTIAEADARRSYAVMRGLTSSCGGMVAAATTSLPERAEAGRNYDYRYVWIRDQCYAGQAMAAAGDLPLLDDAVRFVTARLAEDGPRLAPAYTAAGGPVPEQRQLDLGGYPGGFDLVGNEVGSQFQLDAFGECLLLLTAAADHDRLDADGVRAMRTAADAITRRRHEPDAGIWELAPRRWTHSRLICAAGLRAAADAQHGKTSARSRREAAEWRHLADALLADVEGSGLHRSGRWQRADDDEALDAALLMPAVRGAVPADDPRTVRTLNAFLDELTEDHYAYRFRHDERPLTQAEGAFVLCGFMMALAEHQQGRTGEALRWFERNRAACGPPGLFAEEYDVVQREMRGNLPQAFVHALMLESAARLAKPWAAR
ncbi:glycoside hydrolase family 15 protein [Streptomyces sp. V4-01]|uniref:Glycoside hydrolase family 15 protein n=1 Tax=Actinacidiphila polyblastidii TaxID=3110430 RepID=A0ABU7PK78_9ACTN|nr:glycoside hydrolase family 15 protein [Streptomyces sp. V4-01]